MLDGPVQRGTGVTAERFNAPAFRQVFVEREDRERMNVLLFLFRFCGVRLGFFLFGVILLRFVVLGVVLFFVRLWFVGLLFLGRGGGDLDGRRRLWIGS